LSLINTSVSLTEVNLDDVVLRSKVMDSLKAPSATARRSLYMKLYYGKDLCPDEQEIYLRHKELITLVDDEDHNCVDNIVTALVRRVPLLKVSRKLVYKVVC
jgi:hypothetical protein